MKKFISMISAVMIFAAVLLSQANACWLSDDDAVNKEAVVVIHGLGRSNSAMWLLASRLEDAGYFVKRVGYRSFGQTPEEIKSEIAEQINDCCSHHEKDVHFVGHSLGGLLIRAYLQENQVENLGQVVLIGTPNHGTPVVNTYRDKWWMKMLGKMTLSLGTTANDFPASLDEPYYPVGVIAGVTGDGDNDKLLPGLDDGLVSVESTRLVGMSDFAVVDTSHSYMRYDKTVADLTIDFLKIGKFQIGMSN